MTVLLGTLDGGEQKFVFYIGEDGKKQDKYWAERGMIHHERILDGSGAYQSLTIKEALYRVRAINDMLGGTQKGRGTTAEALRGGVNGVSAQHVRRLQRFVEEMIDLIRRAKAQGDPNDPKASKEVTETRKQRQPKSVVVPSQLKTGW